MTNKSNVDTSSSEDEAFKDALQEATDHQFLKNTYFSTKKSCNLETPENSYAHKTAIQNENLTSSKSLRRNLEQNDKFDNFGVSASFQNYVAKKLDEMIDRSIRLKNRKEKNSLINGKRDVNNESGIKLLNSSLEFVTTEEEEDWQIYIKKRTKVEDIQEESTNLLKCKEAAVDPEWILTRKDTKAWTNKRKDPEFKYKKQKNGILVEQL